MTSSTSVSTCDHTSLTPARRAIEPDWHRSCKDPDGQPPKGSYGLNSQAVTDAWRDYAEGVWRVVRKLRKLRNPRVRSTLSWQMGWHMGLLEGALIHRVAPVPQHR